jgi:hypothetical protein
MNSTSPPAAQSLGTSPIAQRFDRKFIEEHRLIERYLDGKLPLKGAQELENWCRSHPEFLDELRLSERTHASLQLLEASGRPQDLGEAVPPWWRRTPYLLAGLGALTLASVVAFGTLFGKYIVLTGQLDAARAFATQGSLVAPSTERELRIAPDHAAGIDATHVAVSRAAKELLQLRIDMSYSHENAFRIFVDKHEQGRVLVVDNLLKDSNGELKLAFNTSGLTPGRYDIRIEAIPARGLPIAEGWLLLDAT